MFSFLSGFTAALAVFSFVASTQAVPLIQKLRSLSPEAQGLLKRSIPAAPRFMIYGDAWASSLPTPADIKGYNVFALSFWMTTGPSDMALQWQGFTECERTSYLNEYNIAGISIIVSAFGSTDTPTSSGTDPVTIANNLASWVLQYNLQGVDIDYEDLDAFDTQGTAEQWLISLTQELRKELPQGEYILAHAPLAPWFSPDKWNGGGYLHVHQVVGHLIDWYSTQFYNQGYTTCSGLLDHSSDQWPQSALFEIVANGVDSDKLVIGKPASVEDANRGYMSTDDLHACVQRAHAAGWHAGLMVWQYPDATSVWIGAVRGM